jgi:hypothetical protein
MPNSGAKRLTLFAGIISQTFAVYVALALLHNRASDFHPEEAHLNVPEADCPYCDFTQSAQEHV